MRSDACEGKGKMKDCAQRMSDCSRVLSVRVCEPKFSTRKVPVWATMDFFGTFAMFLH